MPDYLNPKSEISNRTGTFFESECLSYLYRVRRTDPRREILDEDSENDCSNSMRGVGFGHDCDGGGGCQRPGEKPAKVNPSGREERRTDQGRIQGAGEGAGARPAPRSHGQVRRQIHLEGARTDQQGTEQVQQAHLQTKARSPGPQL